MVNPLQSRYNLVCTVGKYFLDDWVFAPQDLFFSIYITLLSGTYIRLPGYYNFHHLSCVIEPTVMFDHPYLVSHRGRFHAFLRKLTFVEDKGVTWSVEFLYKGVSIKPPPDVFPLHWLGHNSHHDSFNPSEPSIYWNLLYRGLIFLYSIHHNTLCFPITFSVGFLY